MKHWLAGLALAVLGAAALIVALNLRDEGGANGGSSGTTQAVVPGADAATAAAAGGTEAATATADTATDTAAIERGRYLALAGNCAGCHTAAGGAAYAGGVGIPTPFGVVFAGNLTPDAATGLGEWSAGEFWRALHNGRSRDGRLLYPAFPYTHFTQVTRADSDALFAYLRSVPAVAQANRAHELAFPYSTQAALAVWRALYFRPGVFASQPGRDAEWNRGAYLVRGLGHCSACHAPRGSLGGVDDTPELQGGLIPQLGWFAPALAPVADGPDLAELQARWVALLKTGMTAHGSASGPTYQSASGAPYQSASGQPYQSASGQPYQSASGQPYQSASGPMAEVVFRSTQHLRDSDLRAIARFLVKLPARPAPPQSALDAPLPAQLQAGRTLYKDHCAACHGDDGEGVEGAYPPLAGNATVLMEPPANLVRMVLEGGFLPATAGNPRPYGMPPFAQSLSNAELAAVLNHVRNAWGNQAPALRELDVARYR